MKSLLTIAASVIWMIGTATIGIAAEPACNFLVIVVDDLGRDWVGCYGGKGETPSIDRLAEVGVRYENAWAMPVGTTTRVSMLTGQYPYRHGWDPKSEQPIKGQPGFAASGMTTLADRLGHAGYRTMVAGRWWLDDLERQPDAASRLGFASSALIAGTQEEASGGGLLVDGRRVDVEDARSRSVELAMEFLEQATDRPFFLFVNLAPGLEFPIEAGKDEIVRARYADWVQTADRLIGELMNRLHRSGHAKSTLVLLLGDNGSPVAGESSGQPSVVGKGKASDAGAHVPCIIQTPFLTIRNRRIRDLVDVTDVYPTLLEMADVADAGIADLSGRSMVAGLRGSDDPFDKRSWIYAQVGGHRIIRDWHHFVDDQGGFYDLDADPTQQSKVSVQDKQAPHREQRLKMILGRLGGGPDELSSDTPPQVDQ